MTGERTDAVWLEEQVVYSVEELVRVSGLPQPIVADLIDCGALPTSPHHGRAGVVFETECVMLARAAGRLRAHFELDERGLAVAVSLLRRVHLLEARMARAGDPGGRDA